MMDITRVPIDQLVMAEKNVRMHPEKQVKEYARSLKQNGQLRPVVVDEEYNVWIGNGMLLAAKLLNWTEIDVLIKRNLSEHDKMRMMVADNKIYALGIDNLSVIDEILAELAPEGDIPGYDDDFLNIMFADELNVDEELNSFGIMQPDEIQKTKATADKRRSQQDTVEPEPQSVTERAVQSPFPEGNATPREGENVTERPTEATGTHEAAEQHRYVTCPKCGELIWL